ncbi:metallophosphoesterase [Legionella israelensis]|uniref:metallophosphoesterase family protein n=1 Tax=Legionella israelensis TaxID=454 RepID=UPI00117F6026|nr:metallophosphoesterase [Legionella israelensis]QDP73177.1 metallophosphoesterase [Legionella israelensis]
MKIVHISDLHFGLHDQSLIKPFLEDIFTLHPDVILISGDLTQRAKHWQFVEARFFFRELPGNVLIVPGNHDIPFYNPVARLLKPFKRFEQYVSAEFGCIYTDENVRILGLNSVNPQRIKNGKLHEEDFNKINTFFSKNAETLNILFFHHNFDSVYDFHKPLENADQLLECLKSSPVNIVCTGHLHYSNLALFKKKQQQVGLILHGGSLFCKRSKDLLNSYFVLEVIEQECTIHWRAYKNTHFHLMKSCRIDFHQSAEQISKLIEDSVGHPPVITPSDKS